MTVVTVLMVLLQASLFLVVLSFGLQIRMADVLYLGFHKSHDSSLCLADETGKMLFVASEERFTRKKLQAGIPLKYVSIRTVFHAAQLAGANNVRPCTLDTYNKLTFPAFDSPS